MLGLCNNPDGIINSIELDQRERYLADRNAGYSVVTLRYPRVLVYIKSADEAGLQLDHLPRGVIAIGPVEKNFKVVGTDKRELVIKRRQLPLTAGCSSSVHLSQGQTMRNIILDIRIPPGNRMDSAASYLALSRATCLEDLYLLFLVTLVDLNKLPNKGVLALLDYLNRLDGATLSVFLQHPARFTPKSVSLAPVADVGPPLPRAQQKRGPNRHGHGATRTRGSLTYLRTAITVASSTRLWHWLWQRGMRNTQQTQPS